MAIQYIEPLSQSISRAKRDLFKPFDFRKWFVVGLTAFLAMAADIQMSGGFPGGYIRKGSKPNLEDVLYFPQRALEWLANHPGWAMLIAAGVFLAVAIGVVITWLSARGKFMFLDNVVRSQSRVVAPWYEYRKEANSFFWWHLLWGMIFTGIVLAYLLYCVRWLQALYAGSGNGRILLVPSVLAGLGLFALSLAALFIFLLGRDFVIPIMYRDRTPWWDAVQKFLPLFFSEFLYFLGYALFRFCLSLLIAAAIILLGCGTCCIAFVILAIPYINAVFLLPVSYALRAFSVEFLEQFGPEYRIFPRPEYIPPTATV